MAVGVAVTPNPSRMAGPSPLVTEAKGTVLEPSTTAESPNEMGVPEIVTGDPPRWISVLPIEKPDGFAVNF